MYALQRYWLKRANLLKRLHTVGCCRRRCSRPCLSGDGVLGNRVNKANTCWLWRGSKYGDGYGRFNYAGQNYRAHVDRAQTRWPSGSLRGNRACIIATTNFACVHPDILSRRDAKNNTDDIWNLAYGIQTMASSTPSPNSPQKRCWKCAGCEVRRASHLIKWRRAFNISNVTAVQAVLGRSWKRSVPFNADDLADLKKIRAKRPRLPDALILKKSLRRRQRQDRQRALEAENAP